MTAPGRSDQSTRTLAIWALLAAVLLGLCACGAVPAADGRSDQVRAPGVYFHNDVTIVSGVGAGSRSR